MFEHYWRTIEGWPNQLPYVYAQMVQRYDAGAHFVEIGAYKGASTVAMCVEIANSGKKIKFDVIDKWDYVQPDWNGNQIYAEFLHNIEPVNIYCNPRRMHSVDASKTYPDSSLDFVCIDAEHTYSAVLQDIVSWLPKLRSGGIIAGDDYSTQFPGLVRAVNELLPQRTLLRRAWMWIKP